MRCTDCGADEAMAVWPGEAGETTDLFRLLPSRPAKGWCMACWQKRWAPRLQKENSHKMRADDS